MKHISEFIISIKIYKSVWGFQHMKISFYWALITAMHKMQFICHLCEEQHIAYSRTWASCPNWSGSTEWIDANASSCHQILEEPHVCPASASCQHLIFFDIYESPQSSFSQSEASYFKGGSTLLFSRLFYISCCKINLQVGTCLCHIYRLWNVFLPDRTAF